MLGAFGMRLDGVIGIDAVNRILLIQRSAIDESLVLEEEEPVDEVELDGSGGTFLSNVLITEGHGFHNGFFSQIISSFHFLQRCTSIRSLCQFSKLTNEDEITGVPAMGLMLS